MSSRRASVLMLFWIVAVTAPAMVPAQGTIGKKKPSEASKLSTVLLIGRQGLRGWLTHFPDPAGWSNSEATLRCSGPASHLVSETGGFAEGEFRGEWQAAKQSAACVLLRTRWSPTAPAPEGIRVSWRMDGPDRAIVEVRAKAAQDVFLVSEAVAVTPDEWVPFLLELQGRQLKLTFGKQELSATIPEHPGEGDRIAVGHQLGETAFRQLQVKKPTTKTESPPRKPRPTDVRTFRTHQYALIGEHLTWEAAQKKCEELGGHLATIESPEESQFLLNWCAEKNQTVLLGASDAGHEGDWRWVTGAPLDLRVTEAHIDNYEGQQHWLSYWPGSRSWNDYSHYPASFLCEWEDVTPPAGVPEVLETLLADEEQRIRKGQDDVRDNALHNYAQLLKEFQKELDRKAEANVPAMQNALKKMLAELEQGQLPQIRAPGTVGAEGHDYALVPGEYTWHVAKHFCQAVGGHLATSTNAVEFNVIDKLCRESGKDAWLGGTDEEKEGVWRWVTGEPFQFDAFFDNWAESEHHLNFYARDKRYNDLVGGARFAFICEWESVGIRGLADVGNNSKVFAGLVDAYNTIYKARDTARQNMYRVVHETAQKALKQSSASPDNKDAVQSYAKELYGRFGFQVPPADRIRIRNAEYYLFTEPSTWHEAQRKCEEYGGQLAVLDGPGEVDAVLAKLNRKNPFWIGVTAENKARVFTWIGGAPCNMKFQRDGEPNVDNHVIYWSKIANWSDHAAGFRAGFLCKWPHAK